MTRVPYRIIRRGIILGVLFWKIGWMDGRDGGWMDVACFSGSGQP